MKNIYFYIYPEKKFEPIYIHMSMSQIDNSLELGWKPEDIIVVTNFPWEYKGVKSLVVDDELNVNTTSHGTSLSNKPKVITYLIENDLVDNVNWFHDWDIFQLSPLDLSFLDRDIGLADYSYKPRIQLGSIFFKPRSLDVFHWITDGIENLKQAEEETVNTLVSQNFNNINDRIQKLDASYNVGMINLQTTLESAPRPLKIAHFPPYHPKYLNKARRIIPKELDTLLTTRFRPMKNVLVYISPNKKFNPEHEAMVEVQINNSLDYWKPEDLILLTNFPYEYKGIRAIVAPDNLINESYHTNPRGIINSKVDACIYLLENKIVTDLAWFHDVDSFQLAPLDLPPITKDLGVVGYGIYPKGRLQNLPGNPKFRVNFGNFFFTPNALDIFKTLLLRMAKDGLYEEDAMTMLLAENEEDISSRVQIMNQTYNIGMRAIRSNVAISDKPIRIAHFPPQDSYVLHRFSRLLPPKLYKMLSDKFQNEKLTSIS